MKLTFAQINFMVQLLLISLISLFTTVKHDFHTSITNAELNSKTQGLEITMKVFTDDLELTIKNGTGAELDLISNKPHPKADSLIFNYLLDHFAIKSDRTSKPPIFIGKEMENGITFIYLEIESFSIEKELVVRNTVFFDTFDDQSNIVNIEVRGELESAYLTRKASEKTLEF